MPEEQQDAGTTGETSAADASVQHQGTSIRRALTRYRVMAYVVGILLVVLICIGLPLRYLAPDPGLNKLGAQINGPLGVAHGWLYMLLIITAVDLGRRVRWGWKWLLGIALAGTIPFLSFVAEHKATANVRAYLGGLDSGD